MSTREKPSNFKLKAELERAAALIQQERIADAAELLATVAPELPSVDGYRLLVHCLDALGREADAARAILEGALKFPKDEALSFRAGVLFYEQDRYQDAVNAFRHAGDAVRDEPEAAARYAHALLELGRSAEAFREAKEAFARRPNGIPALIFGMAALAEGDLDAANDSLVRAANSLEGPARTTAEGMHALVLFWRGESQRALDGFRQLDARGELDATLTDFFAIAAALQGDEAVARQALARSGKPEGATALLARARVELALNRPEDALSALTRVADAPPEIEGLVAGSRGRALRMLGRNSEAREVLSRLIEVTPGTVAAMALVDLARLESDDGKHEEAAVLFERAIALDAHSEEAAKGLSQARKRLAWRSEVASDARSQVQAARAEADAMRRAFAEREREVELLRRKLAQLEKAATVAEEDAKRLREGEGAERKRALHAELEIREQEAPSRAEEALHKAFGKGLDRCPKPVLELLRVAELTYQKALYTELHPASIAVLYSGALERGLYQLLLQPFDKTLTDPERERFLKGATRELRQGKAEYFDRFVEAFDRARRARPPSLGEIARALSRRNEPHLRPFQQFLAAKFGLTESFFDALATFVERAKEELRDPVAHGHALALSQGDLARFRTELLFDLAGTGRGALPALVGS